MVNEAAERFFTTIQQTQAKLEQIDKLSLATQRYLSYDRTTWFSLAITSILWFLLGIALPLALLAFPQTTVAPLAATAILLATFLFAAVSVVQFGINFQAKPFDWQNYVKQRWYTPILEEFKREEVQATLRNGGLV